MREHWEKLYSEWAPQELSWHQEEPALSLRLIRESGARRDGALLDAGGGASRLVDRLLEDGWTDVTVLDLSAKALAASRARLGERAARVRWVEGDAAEYAPARPLQVWHDRAAFHFLTEPRAQERYVAAAARAVAPGGVLVLAGFAPDGPEKCSGLPVRKLDETLIEARFGAAFVLERSERESHRTPRGAEQRFAYFLLRRRAC